MRGVADVSTSPEDIAAERLEWLVITGLAGNSIGIAADPAHLQSGGYHCGPVDLQRINAVANDDYSIRLTRDRAYYTWAIARGVNVASATDIGSTWGRGGRAAWVRFCVLLRLQLGARDPDLAAVRGINYTNAAGQVRRFDCVTLVESASSDADHTHIEFWRDTVDTVGRIAALVRITAIMLAARDNVPLTTGEDMDAGQALALQQIHNRVEALLRNRDSRTLTGTANVYTTEPNELADAVAATGLVIDDATRLALATAVGDALGAQFEARLTAWANSPDGRAALTAAANAAEDS
jgi:hypothetical protein